VHLQCLPCMPVWVCPNTSPAVLPKVIIVWGTNGNLLLKKLFVLHRVGTLDAGKVQIVFCYNKNDSYSSVMFPIVLIGARIVTTHLNLSLHTNTMTPKKCRIITTDFSSLFRQQSRRGEKESSAECKHINK
jgi:hypothetical protein